MVVAAYVDELGQRYARATVKQRLPGIRMLFDWLVIGHALETNPAASVRGRRHVVTKGKTPVLSADEAHHLVQEYMDAYVEVAGIAEYRDGPLFRAAERGRKRPALSERALTRERAWEMVKRRAVGAGLPYEITPHSFRGTGIREYLRGGGDRDVAANIERIHV